MPVTNFFWDAQNLLQEYDDSGATTAKYVTAPSHFGDVISQVSGGQSHSLLDNGLGSIVGLTDDSGSLVGTTEYDAWGTITHQSGRLDSPFHYGGRFGYYHEPSPSLYYIRRRHYHNAQARWMSVDPMWPFLNAYTYAYNSPLNGVDPSGLIAFPFERQNYTCTCGAGPTGKVAVVCLSSFVFSEPCFDGLAASWTLICFVACENLGVRGPAAGIALSARLVIAIQAEMAAASVLSWGLACCGCTAGIYL